MFLLSNEDQNEILLKSDSGYVIHFSEDGTPDYPSVSMEEKAPGDTADRQASSDNGNTVDSLILNLGSARDFDEKHQVKLFTGRISYRQRNAYGQLICEGEIPASDQAVIISLGDLIDMSDSTLVLVNISEDDAWKKLLDIATAHRDELTGSTSTRSSNAAGDTGSKSVKAGSSSSRTAAGRPDKADLKALDDFIRYASAKCGITPPPEKKRGLLGLFHR